jgi:DNA-binding NtrC family response regulator
MNASQRHRLLVVDDEPDLRTLYELTLLREGYHIDTAGSVGEALDSLAEHRFSLVITDMRLPDGTGLDSSSSSRPKAAAKRPSSSRPMARLTTPWRR